MTEFICEICDYKCLYQSHYSQHLNSRKHQNNGKKPPRKDKILENKCKSCDYTTRNNTCMRVHLLTNHSTKEERKEKFKYYCDVCDFGTFAEILFKRHNETKKHNLLISNGKAQE